MNVVDKIKVVGNFLAFSIYLYQIDIFCDNCYSIKCVLLVKVKINKRGGSNKGMADGFFGRK